MRNQGSDHDIDTDPDQGRPGQGLGLPRLQHQDQGGPEIGDGHPGNHSAMARLRMEPGHRTEHQQRQQPCFEHAIQREQIEFAPLVILGRHGRSGGQAQTGRPMEWVRRV